MDWRATVNLFLIQFLVNLILYNPYSVEGGASLRGIEHNFRTGRRPSISKGRFPTSEDHRSHDDNQRDRFVNVNYDYEYDYDIAEDKNYDTSPMNNYDYYEENSDRSYKYEFDANGYSRVEESDPSGLVIGSYSYLDTHGNKQSVSYKAGANIGFVPLESNGLHPEIMASFHDFGKRTSKSDSASQSSTFQLTSHVTLPPMDRAASNLNEASRTSSMQENTGYKYPRPETPVDLYNPPTNGKKHQSSGVTSPPKKGDTNQPMMRMFTPYSFGFDEQDLSREESSDNLGNVKGSYAYVNGDGNRIEVKYSAGAEKGFVVENEKELKNSVHKATIGSTASYTNDLEASSNGQNILTNYKEKPADPVYGGDDRSPISFVGPNIDENTWESDGTYSFGYKNADSERNEVADKNGIVTGSYVILDASGKPMTLRYRAGPGIGFVVENLDEVNARSVPQPLDEGENVKKLEVLPTKSLNRLDSSKSEQLPPLIGSGVLPPKSSVSDPKPTKYVSSSTGEEMMSYNQPEDNQNDEYDDYYDPDADRSYSFSFSEDRGVPGWISSRQEEADSDGQVKGRYSYVNDDGNEISVQYSAGAGTGFVVHNDDELKAQVQKATESAYSKVKKMKIVKKPRKDNKQTKDNANRRTVVRKGQRRISQTEKNDINAVPLSIVGTSSSSISRSSDHSSGEVVNVFKYPRKMKPIVPSTLYELPSEKPSPTTPSTLYNAPPTTPPPTLPPKLYTSPEKSRTSPFESFPFYDVAKFITPQGNLIDIYDNNDNEKDYSYDYYYDGDYSGAEDIDKEYNGDGSFDFSFENEKLAHQESSDANGERFGSYSYVDPLGKTVVVKYRAGVNGFEILNPEDVLPKSPVV